MNFRVWQSGLLLTAVVCMATRAMAQEVAPHPYSAVVPEHAATADISHTEADAPHDAFLSTLSTRLRSFLARQHMRGVLRFEEDLLVVEVDTRHENLHLFDMRGRQRKALHKMTVPSTRGWLVTFQVVPGNYRGQAVRPWTHVVTYPDQAGRAVSWTRSLAQYSIKANNTVLWVNLDYGNNVSPSVLDKLKAAVQHEANRST